MELLRNAIDFILHIDIELAEIVAQHHAWTYLILFCIVFCETGLVVTPLLPGDSLLFATGAIAATGALALEFVMPLLFAAALCGDVTNYHIGKFLGPGVFSKQYRLLNKKHLEKTHAFYEKHGGKTVVIARFVPIVRTFAPFVAGVGTMTFSRFIGFSVLGALLWVILFCCAGYFFGNLPAVKENFTLVIFAIIVLSLMPPVIEYIRHKMKK